MNPGSEAAKVYPGRGAGTDGKSCHDALYREMASIE